MDDDLVLLTSYFNIANGRRQDTADTFRVDPSLPSHTSPDGTAALYIITESSTAGHMGPRARRVAADTIAWEYSSHGDDPPAHRLKAALRTAHDSVLQEFDGHVKVGVSVIAVEHKDVYLAQIAPAQVYVIHDGSLHSITAANEEASDFEHALGARSGPQITVFRDLIESGDVLSLCSSWYHRATDPEELRECFGAGTADDIAESLFDLGREHDIRDASVIVIEAALASELENPASEETPGLAEQVDQAVQVLANVGRMLWGELKAPATRDDANGHAPPVEDAGEDLDEDAPETRAGASPAGKRRREETRRSYGSYSGAVTDATTEVPQVSPGGGADEEVWNPDATATWDLSELQEPESPPPPVREFATQEVPSVQPSVDADDLSWDGDTATTHGAAEPLDSQPPEDEHESNRSEPPARAQRGHPADEFAARSRSELEEVNSRIQNDLDFGDVIPPVQAFDETSTEPERIYATSKDIQAVNRRPRRFGNIARPGGRDASTDTPIIRPGLNDIDLRKPVSRPAPPAVIWLAIVVICAFALFAGYKLLERGRHPVAVTNPYPSIARRDVRLALAATTPTQQDTYLAKARTDIASAKRAGDSAGDLKALRRSLQAASDTIYKITLEPSPVVVAKGFQQPTEVAISPDTVYVLDAGKHGVFSVPLNSTSAPTEIVQSSETDSGITIGTPEHIATSQTVALVLDDKYNLVRDAGGTKTAAALVAPSSQGEKIVAMANFGPDVYLLDQAGNQVWRYPDAVNSDNSVPSGFLANNAADLGQPVSFALDDTAMYILKADGQVLKLNSTTGATEPFKDTRTLRLPLKSPDNIFTDVGLPYVWIADPGTSRIVQLDKNGNYIRSYKASKRVMDLSQVKGVVVPSPSDKTIYILDGTELYSIPVTP